MKSLVDLIGKKFGKLTVLNFINDSPRSAWNCICDCGNFAAVRSDRMISGETISCGCMRGKRKNKTSAVKTHPLYNTWRKMKGRCEKKSDKDYLSYGGRGISVCERWSKSFEFFVADMGPKPTQKHSLDRKNNNGNYDPSNCKWSTQSEQNKNQRQRRRTKS